MIKYFFNMMLLCLSLGFMMSNASAASNTISDIMSSVVAPKTAPDATGASIASQPKTKMFGIVDENANRKSYQFRAKRWGLLKIVSVKTKKQTSEACVVNIDSVRKILAKKKKPKDPTAPIVITLDYKFVDLNGDGIGRNYCMGEGKTCTVVLQSQ